MDNQICNFSDGQSNFIKAMIRICKVFDDVDNSSDRALNSIRVTGYMEYIWLCADDKKDAVCVININRYHWHILPPGIQTK